MTSGLVLWCGDVKLGLGLRCRDVKPENVLLAADGTVKLSDFGFGSLPESARHGDGLLRTSCGTPNYIAPEVLSQRAYDGAAADVWSLGEHAFQFFP